MHRHNVIRPSILCAKVLVCAYIIACIHMSEHVYFNKHRYINSLLLAIDEPRIMHAYFNTCHSFKNRNAGTCFDLSSFSTCLPQLLTCQIGKMALISLRCWHIEPGRTLSRHVRSLQFLVFLVPWENRVQGSNAVHDKRIQAAQEMLAVQMQRTQWRSGESSYCS